MNQHTIQLGAVNGRTYATRINWYLKENPGWRLQNVHPISNNELIAVFEKQDDSVGGEFKE